MHGTTEQLRLRGPASTAWSTIAPVLGNHLGTPTEDHRPWVLSGGTLLAARWQWHRDSNDIDVVVADEAALSLWAMADPDDRLGRLDEDLERNGWILDPTRTTAWQRGYRHRDAAQALDLFADDLRPPMAPVRAVVDRIPAYAAGTAQILHGKLRGRGHRAPVRDLYDLAVAGRRDPHALRCALRHIDSATFTRNLALQLQRTDPYRIEARSFLTHPADAEAAADPAPSAAREMIASYPAVWRITRSGTRWRIETFNVHERPLEVVDESHAGGEAARSPTAAQLGAPAHELLRRTPNDTGRSYRDRSVDARILDLEREAEQRAASRRSM